MRNAGINVCSGGIVGLGEGVQDRVGLLFELATMPIHPGSVPINMLVPIEGTPLADVEKLDVIDWIRTIAVARIIMPKSYIRLSAGRISLTLIRHWHLWLELTHYFQVINCLLPRTVVKVKTSLVLLN